MTDVALAATLFGPEDLRMVAAAARAAGRRAWCASSSAPAAFAAPTCTISAMPAPATSSSRRRWCLAMRSPATVVEINAQGTRLKVGDHVAVNPSRWCGHCARCREGRANLCENIYFMGSASKTPHMQGGFATLFDATPAQCVIVPKDLPFASAALAEPLAVCLHAVSRAGDLKGKRVALFGAGPIGLLTMLSAKLAGAGHLTMIDIASQPLAFAKKLGANETFDISDGNDKLMAAAWSNPSTSFSR